MSGLTVDENENVDYIYELIISNLKFKIFHICHLKWKYNEIVLSNHNTACILLFYREGPPVSQYKYFTDTSRPSLQQNAENIFDGGLYMVRENQVLGFVLQ